MKQLGKYYIPLDINGQKCDLYIGEYNSIFEHLSISENTIFITDENLFALYPEFFHDKKYIVLLPGESGKSLSEIEKIYIRLLDLEADRSANIIGFGGGVVTDITGFIGSTFMRGIKFGFISTSLLGQVDAVIGGKNGVNLKGYKNLVGTFNQPEFIINDPKFFDTLPDQEFISGTAEVVKQFVITDHESFNWFNDHFLKFKNKDHSFLKELIFRQNKIKTEIVKSDEKENGLRKLLNFGHTIGHAIERESGLPHGFAISIGMYMEAKISVETGHLSLQSLNVLGDFLQHCQLPVKTGLRSDLLFDAIKKDKKRKGDSIDFIFLRDIGCAEIDKLLYSDLEILLKKVIR